MLGVRLALKALPHDCRICREVEDKRVRRSWGCDKPTDTPQTSLQCPYCDGHRGTCEHCGGTGKIDIFDCPQNVVRNDQISITLINYYTTLFEPFGIMPCAGGYYDQPNLFCLAMEFIAAEWVSVENSMVKKKRR